MTLEAATDLIMTSSVSLTRMSAKPYVAPRGSARIKAEAPPPVCMRCIVFIYIYIYILLPNSCALVYRRLSRTLAQPHVARVASQRISRQPKRAKPNGAKRPRRTGAKTGAKTARRGKRKQNWEGKLKNSALRIHNWGGRNSNSKGRK